MLPVPPTLHRISIKRKPGRTLSVSSDSTKIGLLEGHKEPLCDLLPKLRVAKQKKDLKHISASPFLVRKRPDLGVKAGELLVPLPPEGKRKVAASHKRYRSLQSADELQTYETDRGMTKFEEQLLGKEAELLAKMSEELFPGDPMFLGRNSFAFADLMPARLIFNVSRLDSEPKTQTKLESLPTHRTKKQTNAKVLGALVDYDVAKLRKVNLQSLQDAKTIPTRRTLEKQPTVLKPLDKLSVPKLYQILESSSELQTYS